MRSSSSYQLPSWKNNAPRKEEKATVVVASKPKVAPSPSVEKGKSDVSTNLRNRDIVCFKCLERGHIASQCPNKRVMCMRDNWEAGSREKVIMILYLPREDRSDYEEVADESITLVVMRSLSVQVSVDDEAQRENIFYTHAHVKDKICSVMVDWESQTNVASTTLVTKLGLPTSNHHKPYKLQWLNNCGEIRVHRQVSVPFLIGRYEDEILCDVAPMQVGHLLLGRPWQFDR
ncbi:hypothetical protein Dimus_039649 [Dionaea muscipula]